jgi:hypothetical protein
MNRVWMQIWEISRKNKDILSDGVSIHLNNDEHKKFIDSVYSKRNGEVPDEYDRPVGGLIEIFIEDTLYQTVTESGSVRLSEVEKNNLLKLEEIISKPC